MSVTDKRLDEIIDDCWRGDGARTRAVLRQCMRRAIEEDRGGEKDKQQPGDDGWIPWNGGNCPVDKHLRVQVKILDTTIEGYAGDIDWWSNVTVDSIRAYRLAPSPKNWRGVPAAMGDLYDLDAPGPRSWIKERAIQRAAESRATEGENG